MRRGTPRLKLFIRGQLFDINGVEELLMVAKGIDPERNRRLGHLAYETYCARLSEHQPAKPLSWDRLPPYMHDVWTTVALTIEVYLYDREGKHK